MSLLPLLFACADAASPALDADTALTSAGASARIVATNPILGGDRPDPFVLRTESDDGARYWLVATAGSGADIPVWTSTDLVSWALASEGLFGVDATAGDSIALDGAHYCNVWAPEIAELGPDDYLLTFTATRFDAPRSPCPAYAEDSGVYQARATGPTGPFTGVHAAGAAPTCALRDALPRSLETASAGCQGGDCADVIRLDSTVARDDATDRWWLAYAWYTDAPARTAWETENLGEHVSLVELDADDPTAVRCDAATPEVHAANPHDAATMERLAESCEGCDAMLENGRGRQGEAMERAGDAWGVAEAPTLVRRGGLVYLLVSGGVWDSAYYHVYWLAAPSVEELSWENPDRLAGRFLVPGAGQSFGHGSVVLGPDDDQLYMVHHRLDHDACLAGDCSRPVWLTPLDFEDRDDGRGDVWITPRWPAEGTEVEVALR